ncbi:hypothetical protein KY290_032726 [Solanum tuberosum]|uniref:Replication protein A 70 kDa DNA-binding subunit B/D first OB fold domain-containing protein n=1 Tax=Solanum tuberosum TaxID=4113 RepID=A0ABQ7UCY6_SOLTU|nr:hypothetical protein KY289_032124 [Solanum tuberosum]KAH0744733.1 hypothetical protein KY290_032726 [Solanum tuberosum]
MTQLIRFFYIKTFSITAELLPPKNLLRMCDVISPKKNDELISMNMIFIDEKENLMHGITRKNQVNRFKDKLSEGSVFIIKNFKVVESIGGCH